MAQGWTRLIHEMMAAQFQKLSCHHFVYGTRLDKVDTRNDGSSVSEKMIEYSMCNIREEINMRRIPRVFGSCAYGCSKCSKYRGICAIRNDEGLRGARRKRFREGVVKDLKMDMLTETLEGAHDADDIDDSSTMDPGDLKRNDTFNSTLKELPAAPTPQLLRLGNVSDPCFSRTASSSGIGSFVHVTDQHFAADLNTDDWLIV